MEILQEIFVMFILIVLLIMGVNVVYSVWEFITETPKQLKRIADILESYCKYH